MSRPAVALRSVRARHRAAGRRSAAVVFWRFSRPHTIIGTTLSILGLYAIAAAQLGRPDLLDLFWTLVAGWCVNVSIVGVNQLEDVEIDRVNKPWLPLAAGDLGAPAARRIVAVATIVPVVLALTQGLVELVAVGVALAIGAAYSCPPVRLKRYPVLASLSIALVRTLVVNLGVWLHFAGGAADIAPAVWALTAVTLPFSVAIAILKDMPDIEGDRRFGVATFSVRVGPRPVFALALAALLAAELGMATLGAALLREASGAVLVAAHVAAAALLLRWAARVDLRDRADMTRFYLRVWQLFFAEYVIVPAAALVG